jgi:D-alanyl-D-alanine dipeptidase
LPARHILARVTSRLRRSRGSIIGLLALAACQSAPKQVERAREQPTVEMMLPKRPSPLDTQLTHLGLVDVQAIVPRVVVELRYSTRNNVTGQDLYGELTTCYLQPEVAAQVRAAQSGLDSQRPGLRLKIWDGARPRGVQARLWTAVRGTAASKFVANPSYGSLHNYGAALDLTLVDSAGRELDMGTDFDSFDSLAQPDHEGYFYARGLLSEEQLDNRKLLRSVMTQAGFTWISKEWWHFNAMPLDEARYRYKLIE